MITSSASRSKGLAALIAIVLAVAGCSSSKSSGSGSTSTSTGSGSTLDAAGVSYVGGKPQQATGSPLEIGWVNSDTGPAAFPTGTDGAKAAVTYANAHLNGINGHVIKLDTCSIGSEEDGQACGTQMVNNPNIHAIVEGVVVLGGDTFFKVINNTKVVLQVSANSQADLFPYQGVTNPNVFTLNAGAVGGYNAMLKYAATDITPPIKSVMFIADNAPAAKTGVESFQGQLAQYHLTTKAIYIDPSAGASQVASDIQAGGGNSADLWFMLTDLNTCVNIMTYRQTAGVHPALMGAECTGAAMKALTGGAYAPDGFIVPNTGLTYWLPQESPIEQLINEQVDKDLPGTAAPDSAALSFQQIFNLIRAMNAATDAGSTDAIAAAVRSLAPPIIDNLGPIKCGSVPLFATLCGNQVGLIQAKGNGWVRLSPTPQLPVFEVWQFKS